MLMFCRAIAIPETLHSLEVKNKCDKKVTRFVVPLAASIGRAGTCLYICISCLFVTQIVGLELTITRIALVWYIFNLIKSRSCYYCLQLSQIKILQHLISLSVLMTVLPGNKSSA